MLLLPILAVAFYFTYTHLKNDDANAYVHAYSETWTTDESDHWHECGGCGDKKDVATHIFKHGVCDTCSYAREELEFSYDSESDSYEVVSIGRITGTDITIPEFYDDGTGNGKRPGKSIGFGAFMESNITSVTIEGGVEILNMGCFYNCSNLTSVTFGGSVSEIDALAFYGCSLLTNLTLPNGLQTIGDIAFAYTGITSIHIPASVTSIARNPFTGCKNLTSLTMGSGNAKYHATATA